MKKEEKDYLKIIKHSNGLDYDDAEEDIVQFENSQKQFKILNKELKKKDTRIKNLEKEIEKLREKISNLKQKTNYQKPVTNIKLKKNSNLGKDIFLKDTKREEEEKLKKRKKYITRIKSNIEDEKSYTRTDFKIEFMIPARVLDWTLRNLIKENFLGYEEFPRGTKYFKK